MSSDNQELGAESLLGFDAQDLDGQEARDKLARATLYLANWYRATKGSENQAIWWQRIDVERLRVEEAYRLATAPESLYFLTRAAKAAYADAAADWPQLWRDLKLSADTLPEPSLLDEAATFATAPLQMLTNAGNEIGKAVGETVNQTVGQLVRGMFPVLVAAAGVAIVYIFRRPILGLVTKAAA